MLVLALISRFYIQANKQTIWMILKAAVQNFLDGFSISIFDASYKTGDVAANSCGLAKVYFTDMINQLQAEVKPPTHFIDRPKIMTIISTPRNHQVQLRCSQQFLILCRTWISFHLDRLLLKHHSLVDFVTMGRKPNRLVAEFFTRGTKLDNGSNRYVQTCKACGEVFLKGRIETLLNHLQRRCQSISHADKCRILAQLQELSGPENGIINQQASDDDQTPHQTSLKLPVGHGQKFTGLEALAEASRQIERPGKGKSVSKQNDLIDPSLNDHCEFHGSSSQHGGEQDETGKFNVYLRLIVLLGLWLNSFNSLQYPIKTHAPSHMYLLRHSTHA